MNGLLRLYGSHPVQGFYHDPLQRKQAKKIKIKRHGPRTMPFLHQSCHHGGSGTPESGVENRKNRWKNSLSRRFSRFFRFDFSVWGLGGVQPQSRAPRVGTSGDFFGSFLVSQKGTFRSLLEAQNERNNRNLKMNPSLTAK